MLIDCLYYWVRFPVNYKLLVVKFWGNQKLNSNFWLPEGLLLLTSELFKGQLYIKFEILVILPFSYFLSLSLPPLPSFLTLPFLFLPIPHSPYLFTCQCTGCLLKTGNVLVAEGMEGWLWQDTFSQGSCILFKSLFFMKLPWRMFTIYKAQKVTRRLEPDWYS